MLRVTQTESIQAFVDRYAAALQRLDVSATAEFYSLPCSFIGNAGVVVQQDRDGLESLIAGLFGRYRAIDFGKADVTALRVEILSAHLHQARAHWQLIAIDGSALYDFETIYVIANFGKGHRIAAVIVVNEAERYKALIQQIAGERTFIGKLPK